MIMWMYTMYSITRVFNRCTFNVGPCSCTVGRWLLLLMLILFIQKRLPHASCYLSDVTVFSSLHMLSLSLVVGQCIPPFPKPLSPVHRSGEQCGPCTCPATSDGVTFLSNLSPPSPNLLPLCVCTEWVYSVCRSTLHFKGTDVLETKLKNEPV